MDDNINDDAVVVVLSSGKSVSVVLSVVAAVLYWWASCIWILLFVWELGRWQRQRRVVVGMRHGGILLTNTTEGGICLSSLSFGSCGSDWPQLKCIVSQIGPKKRPDIGNEAACRQRRQPSLWMLVVYCVVVPTNTIIMMIMMMMMMMFLHPPPS